MMPLSCISRVKRTSETNKRPPNYPLFVFASFTGDRSGSMINMITQQHNAPASGAYDFVTEQCKNAFLNDQTCYISVTTFDDETEIPIDNVKSSDIEISYKDCVNWMRPRSTTKLYDTAIKCLNNLEKNAENVYNSFSKKVKNLNPKIVKIWALLTDGFDNASFAKSIDLNRTVTKARKNGTICYFLAANQDACSVGENYGFSQDNSITFGANAECARNSLRAVTQNCIRTASDGISTPFTHLQRQTSGPSSLPNNIVSMSTMMRATTTPLPGSPFLGPPFTHLNVGPPLNLRQ